MSTSNLPIASYPDQHQSQEIDAPSRDELFQLLSNQRRREVLRYFSTHSEDVELRALADWVAAQEYDTTIDQLTAKQRQRVYISLYQTHIPTLVDHDCIEYNRSTGLVRRTDRIDDIDRHLKLESLTRSDPSILSSPFAWLPSLASQYTVPLIISGCFVLLLGWFSVVSPLFLLTISWVGLFSYLVLYHMH
ncbi:DUF7344 domain-containing protein [Halalkalicoccus jeotgali]|uniref:DUF7344 domain-containing protein n=1 Tax=Halalkalicoccus jeotgali (strain DSM 18796 / CECT 7217 / JCM 14584 / KCTC 4019 / B3) TaxID=795797 RepID=D8J766_HALJB|nr:hypothetical protein HacjB3_02840 [Halalkalicoccus jeotgali B3]ELY33994.1 hypothetical protein C497_16472 [Halalkalicoccus jeotgali B3]